MRYDLGDGMQDFVLDNDTSTACVLLYNTLKIVTKSIFISFTCTE